MANPTVCQLVVSGCFFMMLAVASATVSDGPGYPRLPSSTELVSSDVISLVQLKAELRAMPAAIENSGEGLDDSDLAFGMSLIDRSPILPDAGRGNVAAAGSGSFPTDDMTAFGSSMKKGKGAVVIGFGYQKCGTTFLSGLVKGHGNSVYTQIPKELHYVVRHNPDRQHDEDKERESHCARTTKGPITFERYMEDCFANSYPKSGQMVFDFTPDYAAPSNVDYFVKATTGMMQSASQHNQELRLVAVLRNPVERAISEANMKRKVGRKNSKDASDADLDSMLMNHILSSQARWTHPFNGYPPVMTFGEYNQSISVVLKAFPKDSVLLINMAKMDQMEVWRRVHAHFGLNMPAKGVFQSMFDSQVTKTEKHTEEKYAAANTKKYEPSDKVAKALADYYKPFDEHLWKLIGTKWW